MGIETIDLNWMQARGFFWNGCKYHVLDLACTDSLQDDQPFRSDYFMFFIWLEGGATITGNQLVYELRRQDAFIFLPGIVYRHAQLPGTVRRGVVIAPDYLARTSFNSRFTENMALSFRHLPLSLQAGAFTAITGLLDFLTYLTRGRRESCAYREEAEENAFFALFCEVFSLYKRHLGEEAFLKKSPRSLELWTRFLGLLAIHFREKRSVGFYADQLYITPNYFSETIKSLRGKTAGQVIVDAVIGEARALLKNPGLTVGAIADELHFADQATFTKYFKHHTGQSPTQFRKASI